MYLTCCKAYTLFALYGFQLLKALFAGTRSPEIKIGGIARLRCNFRMGNLLMCIDIFGSMIDFSNLICVNTYIYI